MRGPGTAELERGPARAVGPAIRPVLWRDVAVGLAVFGVYVLVDQLDWADRRARADANARLIVDIEQALHLDVERSFNAWLLDHPVLQVIANYEYAFTYIISAFLLIGWLYLRRPDLYPWARNSFIVLNLVGIACFALFPVTPPRLLAELRFVDTVKDSHTLGSWGTPAVDSANQLAAMPSLHLAWALWVSVILGLIAGSWWVQLVSFGHVVVTFLVIVATANHYVLDAAGGAVAIAISLPIAARLPGGHRPQGAPDPGRIGAADAFFLHVETPDNAQNVGGLVLLRCGPAGSRGSDLPPPPTRDEVIAALRAELGALPRFTRRLSSLRSWRRPRLVPAGDLDWDWHVIEHDLAVPPTEAPAALCRYVAHLQNTPLPRDRPLWRLVLVPFAGPDTSALVILTHHVIADGLGTVSTALRLLDVDGAPSIPARTGPGALVRAAAIAKGLAQLATDGAAPRRTHTVGPQRYLVTVSLPMAEVRAVARRFGVRVTDVLLCLVAGAAARTSTAEASSAGRDLRASVTVTVDRSGPHGNATAALLVDLPTDAEPEPVRLRRIAERNAADRQRSRILASRFVMDRLCGLLPAFLHARFARAVYGGRFFNVIVSNLPGPDEPPRFGGRPVTVAYPLLPLAPDAPLAVGGLGVGGSFALGVTGHPGSVADADSLAEALRAVFAELRDAAASAGPSPDRSDDRCRSAAVIGHQA